MKQFPNKLKFKKYHKLNFFYSKSFDKNTFFLSNGLYGIQSLQFGKLQFKHIESCRKTIKRGLKNLGFL
jgi:ribosomal protein L16/L10AE